MAIGAWILLGAALAASPEAFVGGVRVAQGEGRPTLVVDGRPAPPFAYMSYLGKPAYYREVAEAGVHLYCLPAYLGDRGINSRSGIGPFRPAIWLGEGQYDFTRLGEDFAELLTADPWARAVVRLHMDAPSWWEAAHPEACTLLDDGETLRQCFASPLWLEDTTEALRACIAWLAESPYAAHVAGVHVAAGMTEEWYYHYGERYVNRNHVRTEAFRAWLHARYPSDAALQAAWGDAAVLRETAALADISGTDAGPGWRDPEASGRIIDTFRFHSEVMADAIARFCRVVKEASGGRLLTGAFYGYHYFVGDPRMGHFALGRLLDCPDLDYLSSPNVYRRELGEDWPPMVAVGSVQAHGKLWLAENDTRTFKTTLLRDQAPEICPEGYYDGGVWLGPESADDSAALLEKNAARMLAGGYGGWWFDMWGGWFSDPRLLAVIRRTQELGREDLEQPLAMPRAQIAVVVDEELSFLDRSYGGGVESIHGNRYPLAKSGAPYALYLRGDLELALAEGRRAVWILGPPGLTPEEQAGLETFRGQGGATLWTHPEGSEVRLPGAEPRTLPGKLEWTPEELRAVWRDAGVHVYLEADDVLYAGRGWIGVHTVEGGERVLALPETLGETPRVRDAFRDRELAVRGRCVALTLPPRSTTLLRVSR